jgi:hypothetical protein
VRLDVPRLAEPLTRKHASAPKSVCEAVGQPPRFTRELPDYRLPRFSAAVISRSCSSRPVRDRSTDRPGRTVRMRPGRTRPGGGIAAAARMLREIAHPVPLRTPGVHDALPAPRETSPHLADPLPATARPARNRCPNRRTNQVGLPSTRPTADCRPRGREAPAPPPVLLTLATPGPPGQGPSTRLSHRPEPAGRAGEIGTSVPADRRSH